MRFHGFYGACLWNVEPEAGNIVGETSISESAGAPWSATSVWSLCFLSHDLDDLDHATSEILVREFHLFRR